MNAATSRITLDHKAKKPLSMQMADALRKMLMRGAWKTGDVLPCIHELAVAFGTSEKVPRKALKTLEKEGWTKPKRGIGSVVVNRGVDVREKGRILVYVRETGYSYYFSELMSVLDARLLASGYRVSTIHASMRSEAEACRRLAKMLKDSWSFVILVGGRTEAKRIVVDAGCLFALVGDGAPLPSFNSPLCVARIEIKSGRAVAEFIKECVRRRIRSIVQFKYAGEGAFDVSEMLSHAGVAVDSVNIPRKSSPQEVSMAALSEMRHRIAGRKRLPDLFLFTDDYLAQGALVALAVAGVRIPEDVAVVTHANKGLGPVWVKPLSRLEMDPGAHGRAVSEAVVGYLKTGMFPPDLELGSVWKTGETF